MKGGKGMIESRSECAGKRGSERKRKHKKNMSVGSLKRLQKCGERERERERERNKAKTKMEKQENRRERERERERERGKE